MCPRLRIGCKSLHALTPVSFMTGNATKKSLGVLMFFITIFFFHLLGVTTIMLDAGANNAPIVSAKQIRYNARWANGSALKSLKFAENKWTAV